MNTQNLQTLFKKSINTVGLICATLALIFTSAFYSLPAVANQQVVNQPILIAYDNGSDIVSIAVKAGKFNTLAAALETADLVEVLQGKGPFTVFAPTDEAFAALPPGLVEDLLRPENKDKLVQILTYHVVPVDFSPVVHTRGFLSSPKTNS